MKQSNNENLAQHLPLKKSRSKKPLPPPPPPINPSTSKPVTQEANKSIVKEDLISKIIKYQTNRRFATIISKELGFKYTRAQLSKYNIDNLETILHRIRTHLNTRNMDQVFEHMAKVTAKGYEDVMTNFGYDITGFSDLLLSNPAFHDAFERWKIERQIPEIPPSFQLMYIVASTTYMAHIHNKSIHVKREKEPTPPKPAKKKEIVIKDIKEDEKPKLKTTYKPGDIIN